MADGDIVLCSVCGYWVDEDQAVPAGVEEDENGRPVQEWVCFDCNGEGEDPMYPADSPYGDPVKFIR